MPTERDPATSAATNRRTASQAPAPPADRRAPRDAWCDLFSYAAGRHGAFSRAAANRLDVSNGMLRRAIEAGRIARVHESAFVVAGSYPSWERAMVVACDTFGHGSVASRRSAMALLNVAGFPRHVIEVTTDQHRKATRVGIVAHSTSRWLPEDLTVVDGVPTTDPIRTFIDLGADLSVDRHQELLDVLERDRLIVRADLDERLARIRVQGRNGVGYTGRLLDHRPVVHRNPTNAFERKFLRLLERAGLPLPACQVAIQRPDGEIALVDFYWAELLFGVETDGHVAHATREERRRDARRAAALLELGIELIRFTWEQVRHEERDVVASVRRHLARRQQMVASGRVAVTPNAGAQPNSHRAG